MTDQPGDVEDAGMTVAVVGAGPAGLTAAWELIKAGHQPVVFEADDQVGGISRTVERDGWRFDIGGHRFFTKVPRVQAFWHEVLPPEDFLVRPRLSRIYYGGNFFAYPIKPFDALAKLGIVEATRCVASYIAVRLRPPKDQSDFENWVAARFGWRLYGVFFKTYTEKVWGVPASTIRSDWAAQRIKGLSLPVAVLNAFRTRATSTKHTSLIERFHYPRLGPGMMWEQTAELVKNRGGELRLEHDVVALHRRAGGTIGVESVGPAGREVVETDHVISTMPLGELAHRLWPPPPDEVLEAAKGLAHRDFLTVALVVPERCSFPDNWIYIHDPAVKLGRVQNFRAWSPDMVKDGKTCLGLEYFVFEGDEVWAMHDEDLVAFATEEIVRVGLIPPGVVEAGYVVRMPRAYPVYDPGYAERVAVIREWLEREVPNVHPVGRNGMHRYNNQDHSMLTAMLAVENIGGARHDTWSVNVEAQHHETGHYGALPPAVQADAPPPGTGRGVPTLVDPREAGAKATGGTSRTLTASLCEGATNRLVTLSTRSTGARDLFRRGFCSLLAARRRARAVSRRVSAEAWVEHPAVQQAQWRVYRLAFSLSTIRLLRVVQFRLRDRLSRGSVNVVPVDRLLLGGWNGMSAARFAQASGFLADPSTPLSDSPHVELLRASDAGDPLFDDDQALRQTPYARRVAAAIAISGHHRGARSDAEIVRLAHELVQRYRGEKVPYRPGRSPQSSLPRVRRIARSEHFEIRDGHHRLAIAAGRGATEVEVVVERPRSTTPAQRLLRKMSWLDGQLRLYQPVPFPEVQTWSLMRRCTDRLQLMLGHLENEPAGPGKTAPSSYLDVGACYGWFVNEMLQRGYDAYGIEQDPLSRQLGELAYGLDPERLVVGDCIEVLRRTPGLRYDVVSCFSMLHHFVLGRGSCSAEELISLLDAATGTVLFLDTGESHESWFRLVLPEWSPVHIRQWILEHTSFTDVRALGTDQDDTASFSGRFGRTTFACRR